MGGPDAAGAFGGGGLLRRRDGPQRDAAVGPDAAGGGGPGDPLPGLAVLRGGGGLRGGISAFLGPGGLAGGGLGAGRLHPGAAHPGKAAPAVAGVAEHLHGGGDQPDFRLRRPGPGGNGAGGVAERPAGRLGQPPDQIPHLGGGGHGPGVPQSQSGCPGGGLRRGGPAPARRAGRLAGSGPGQRLVFSDPGYILELLSEPHLPGKGVLPGRVAGGVAGAAHAHHPEPAVAAPASCRAGGLGGRAGPPAAPTAGQGGGGPGAAGGCGPGADPAPAAAAGLGVAAAGRGGADRGAAPGHLRRLPLPHRLHGAEDHDGGNAGGGRPLPVPQIRRRHAGAEQHPENAEADAPVPRQAGGVPAGPGAAVRLPGGRPAGAGRPAARAAPRPPPLPGAGIRPLPQQAGIRRGPGIRLCRPGGKILCTAVRRHGHRQRGGGGEPGGGGPDDPDAPLRAVPRRGPGQREQPACPHGPGRRGDRGPGGAAPGHRAGVAV